MTPIRINRNANASASPTLLLPVAPRRGFVPRDIDEWLTRAARSAAPHDVAARNHLFDAYRPRLLGMCFWTWKRFAQGSILSREDVEQEAFLVFAELLGQWSGKGSFSRYLLGSFPWRLRDAVFALMGPREASLAEPSLNELAAISYDVEQAVLLLEDLSRQFTPLDRQILLMRVRDGVGVRQVAAELKVNRRTVQRRLAAMRVLVRHDLTARAGKDD